MRIHGSACSLLLCQSLRQQTMFAGHMMVLFAVWAYAFVLCVCAVLVWR
jgi:hypothetical protein